MISDSEITLGNSLDPPWAPHKLNTSLKTN